MGKKPKFDKMLMKVLQNGLDEGPEETETPDRAENNYRSITGRGFVSPPSPPEGLRIQDLSFHEIETKGANNEAESEYNKTTKN